MRSVLGVVGLVLTAAVFSACGNAAKVDNCPASPVAASAAGGQQLTIKVVNGVQFEPCAVSVRAGEPVELTLQNETPIDHDFVLTEGVAEPVKIIAPGGRVGSGTFTLRQPGTYRFICSMPGHEAAGMAGTITAQ